MTIDSRSDKELEGSPSTSAAARVLSLEMRHPLSQLTLSDLLTETQQYLAQQDMQKIQRAYELASEAHQGTFRRSGEPYIQHPLEVALLLAEMRIDADGIVAALLHDVVEDTPHSLSELEKQFGPAVANIVDGVTKFDALTDKPTPSDDGVLHEQPVTLDKRRQRSETVRKMLLAMAEDPRVVVLKLADRLHNMRTLEAMSPAQQQSKARETMEIYVPLARRLGMAIVQGELEDLAFRYLHPQQYEQLAEEVVAEMERRRPYIERVCQTLEEEMARAKIPAQVHAWQKHLASIERKLEDMPRQVNGGEISQIHDLVSFRIIVNSDAECYLALGHIHALWRPKDGRIKDFIATPKVNGYQSLHTTVFCLDNRLAEIQIRTHEMQRTADYGLASYWYLKERVSKSKTGLHSWSSSYREMVTWIEQLREWQHELPQSADEFVEAVKGDIFQEQIFVFTPKGEVKDLPRGSTPLDMAYRIHTDLGDHCAGARIITSVDDTGRLVTRLVPLDYELKGGEIVDIVTSRKVHPTRDWLSFARTAAARTKIRRYLKTYEREIDLQLGRERLDLALKAVGMTGLQEETERLLQEVRSEGSTPLKRFATLDDIFVALGREDLRIEDAMRVLLPQLPRPDADRGNGNHADGERDGRNHVEGAQSGPQVSLAHCCCPIPGDAIVGILHPSKGISVHRSDCRTLRRYREQPNVKVEVHWLQIEASSFLVPVTIVAHDRSGLLRDVAAVVADAGINMTAVTSSTNASLQKAVITATLELKTPDGVIDQLERVFRRMRQVKNVVSVERAFYCR